MQKFSRPTPIVLGLALFSMFFGSGNLIFPLALGYEAGASWPWALAGFACTAVLLPLLGVVAMVLYEGKSDKFFEIIGNKAGFIFTTILLLIWIPLGSGPRCIALSYASLHANYDIGPPWIYGFIYSALVGLMVWRRRRALDILGKVLTPLLLLCLLAIFISGLTGASFGTPQMDRADLFIHSLIEGYNTQDLIASFFFSASIVSILRRYEGSTLKQDMSLLFKGGMIAAVVLAVVYAMLLYTTAAHGDAVAGVPKEKMLASLSIYTLGPNMGFIAAIAVFLACLTTSVALVVVFDDYIVKYFFKHQRYAHYALFITLAVIFWMSLTGLSGITWVTSPLLQICYPILALLIIYACVRKLCHSKRNTD